MNTSELIKYKNRGGSWELGNDTLYELCRVYPGHKTSQEIVAKIWLIGRAYAAAIERRKNKKTENDNFYESVVVPKIINSQIDMYLYKLKNEKEISEEIIGVILMTHKYVTDLFTEISGIEKRSLASKYLHFHLPDLFYIYDSRAVNSLRSILPRFRIDNTYKLSDREYGKFFLKLNYIDKTILRNEGVKLTPRELDNILLSYES